MAMRSEARPEAPADPVMVDTRWVAAALGCSERHVHQLRDGRLMPAPVKIGTLVRWSRKAIEKWIESGCPGS